MDIKELQENVKVIIKRKGHKEPFDPKKFKRYLMFVTDNDDTMAEILLRDCVVKLKEETKVKVLANAIVDTAVSKISPLQTKWEYVAARAYLLNLYAESYGIKDGRKYPHLNDVLKKGVAAGVYHKDIYSSYTADEINELHEYIRPEEDLTFTYDALKQFVSKYCKDLKRCDTVDEAENIGSDIDWAIGSLNVVEEYEELRKQCEKIRAWGQGWKDIAKKLIEERSDVSDLLADKFSVLLETEGSSCS